MKTELAEIFDFIITSIERRSCFFSGNVESQKTFLKDNHKTSLLISNGKMYWKYQGSSDLAHDFLWLFGGNYSYREMLDVLHDLWENTKYRTEEEKIEQEMIHDAKKLLKNIWDSPSIHPFEATKKTPLL